MLLELANHGGLTDDGRDAARWAVGWLRDLLGPSWPRRQYQRMGWLPGELLMFASHQYGLPSLLSFATRLRAVATVEPTFAPVLTGLRRGLDSTGWRHLQLQLEVARALRPSAVTVTFEPAIPDSNGKADLLIEDGTRRTWLVETTALFGSQVDRQAEQYEERFRRAIWGVEHRHAVHCIIHLDDHLDPTATEDWLNAVELTAQKAQATGVSQTVSTSAGQVTVQVAAPGVGTTVFRGALRSADGLAPSWQGHPDQGPPERWSGTGLASHRRAGRLLSVHRLVDAAVARADRTTHRRATRRTARVHHLQGVVLSCGLAVSLGATDPTMENITAEADSGYGLRRLLAPHLVRETAVIPLDGSAADQRFWVDAYAGEPAWLDEDLAQLGRPPVRALWLS
jgi:hypothetical protein